MALPPDIHEASLLVTSDRGYMYVEAASTHLLIEWVYGTKAALQYGRGRRRKRCWS